MADDEDRERKSRRLQRALSKAIAEKDKDAEIAALLAIGDADLRDEDDPNRSTAQMHYSLAERVMRNSGRVARLHEALGGQGRVARHRKDLPRAIERFRAAEAAAAEQGDVDGQVGWILRRASAHRAAGERDEHRDALRAAEDTLRPPAAEGRDNLFSYLGRTNFGDPASVMVLAELEGQIGLAFSDDGDQESSEEHYRSALSHSELAKDDVGVNVWATNVGNACARTGRYGEAAVHYDKALAALSASEVRNYVHAAMRLADSLVSAYRHEDAGDRMVRLADTHTSPQVQASLLDRAARLYAANGCAEKCLQVLDRLDALIEREHLDRRFADRAFEVGERMRSLLAAAPTPNAVPILDIVLVEWMVEAEETNSTALALQAAHLVCDVRMGLALAGERQWRRLVGGDLLQNAGLDLRVVSDALRMSLHAGETGEALTLLQRLKAPGYCIPALRRLEKNLERASPEARAYHAAIVDLRDAVARLGGPAQPGGMRLTNAIRRAGEAVREAAEALRSADPLLHARLGAPVRKDDIIDALPYMGGIGIVDFVVGRDETCGVALVRGPEGVVALPFASPHFNAEVVSKLHQLYSAGRLPKQLGGEHRQKLGEIASILHDHMFCSLARHLAGYGVNQLILIPDMMTRFLPLHLSRACGKEFKIPGIPTDDAAYLCEVMPIEYASCLQEVAASQHYLRPRSVSRIVGFGNPNGDLPGVGAALKPLADRAPSSAAFEYLTGASVTKQAVTKAVTEADVVIFGTHGKFHDGGPDDTFLVLHGDRWGVTDMQAMSELEKRALFALMACEVGAIAATPDDTRAWGLPGALVAAGACSVLANMWPVEDVSSNLLLEKFLHHLSHPGYRPAAALFRAIRDMRRMTREDAEEYCRSYVNSMREQNAPAIALLGARSLLEWIEDEQPEHPFEDPYFWGASAIFGSGWHRRAGAIQALPPDMLVEQVMRQANAERLVLEWHAREGYALAQQVANATDGVPRASALTLMALALARSATIGTEARVHGRARRLLGMADRIERRESDEKLRKQIDWVYDQLGDDDVVQKEH